MPLKVVNNMLSPEDTYEVLDVALTDILQRSGAEVGNEEVMPLLISYNRQLRIALGLPVDVAN